MRRILSTVTVLACAAGFALAVEGMDWAYPVTPKGKGPPDKEKMLSVPGSKKQYSAAQIGGNFGPPDWFPDEHPPMPPSVASGRQPGVRACALCHLPTGGGHPESANMAGLPVRYIIRSMEEYRNGNRVGVRAATMVDIAKAMNDEEIRSSAEYFASLKPHARQKVVESPTAPKSFVGGGGMRYASPEGGDEAIGARIILIPDSAEGAQRRNPKSNFVAYVPPGSIANGRALAAGANGKTVACGVCHGAGLRGLGDVPGIAGRDPTYIFRQLFDMKEGRRKGDAMVLMKAVVENLTIDDMIALSAYSASLEP